MSESLLAALTPPPQAAVGDAIPLNGTPPGATPFSGLFAQFLSNQLVQSGAGADPGDASGAAGTAIRPESLFTPALQNAPSGSLPPVPPGGNLLPAGNPLLDIAVRLQAAQPTESDPDAHAVAEAGIAAALAALVNPRTAPAESGSVSRPPIPAADAGAGAGGMQRSALTGPIEPRLQPAVAQDPAPAAAGSASNTPEAPTQEQRGFLPSLVAEALRREHESRATIPDRIDTAPTKGETRGLGMPDPASQVAAAASRMTAVMPDSAASLTLATAPLLAATTALGLSDGAPLHSQVSAQPAPITAPLDNPAWGQSLNERVLWMFNNRQQIAQVRIDPPDLGPIEIKISMNDDQASVLFNTQHAAVRDAIEQALPRLREMLAGEGLQLAEANVAHDGERRQDSAAAHTGQPNGDEPDGESGVVATSEDGRGSPAHYVLRGLVDFYA